MATDIVDRNIRHRHIQLFAYHWCLCVTSELDRYFIPKLCHTNKRSQRKVEQFNTNILSEI